LRFIKLELSLTAQALFRFLSEFFWCHCLFDTHQGQSTEVAKILQR